MGIKKKRSAVSWQKQIPASNIEYSNIRNILMPLALDTQTTLYQD